MITVSSTKLSCYKQCQKKYYFRYVERLEPEVKAEALQVGSKYHSNVESIINTGDFEKEKGADAKINAMSEIWKMQIYPQLGFEIVQAEKFFEKQLADDVRLIGYIDGLDKNGVAIEHKTTSLAINEDYLNKLRFNEQIPLYMIGTDKQELWYTAIKKPTIRLKKKETQEEFEERCLAWYWENAEQKTGVFKLTRFEEELSETKANTIELAREMENRKCYHRNPMACSMLSCEYAPICLNYDPSQKDNLIGYKVKEKREHD